MTPKNRAMRIPAPVAAMLRNLGVTIPESGMFKRRVLNNTLLRRRVAPGRIAHLLGELDRVGLLLDDRH